MFIKKIVGCKNSVRGWRNVSGKIQYLFQNILTQANEAVYSFWLTNFWYNFVSPALCMSDTLGVFFCHLSLFFHHNFKNVFLLKGLDWNFRQLNYLNFRQALTQKMAIIQIDVVVIAPFLWKGAARRHLLRLDHSILVFKLIIIIIL